MLVDNETILKPHVLRELQSKSYKDVYHSLKDMDQNLVKEFGNFLNKNEIVSGIDISDLEEDISVFGDASRRFVDDIRFEPVENDKLACANCRHCTNSVISCVKYLQKPSAVLDGSECTLFENN